ncbi:ATPase associated with various cellular activities, AAA-3 [Plesiocystis pacifica SIR-1]|uniref:ATPase associated with various cellular activities, AAA-3 n=1 Tax=Plesiocystis pacifica SIR-1 TaxID=391625 RepID=A6G4L6_9BACT|nr:MoxR family ATPase [Plesiocystis pacifica]EDM79136.1 ATPase associated with various cellular activities, AAA-3 [Plesiocystis pacifica SIR-1]
MTAPEPSTTSAGAPSDLDTLAQVARTHDRLIEQIERRVVGQREVVELLLIALFAGGHALFVGVPGLAKTLLVSSLAEALELDFSRIQFTPDLMPSDITGSEVLEEDGSGRRSFRFIAGPVFCNLLLADEINRTPPKTQAALLQAMQEARVSAGGKTHPLPPPFHVFATQNPIEQEGTYPLPEAQLDRFMLEILVDYPDEDAERRIVAMASSAAVDQRAAITPVLTPAELTRLQELVRRVPVPPSVVDHVVALLRATRPTEERCPAGLRELLRWGAGPRAGQQLVLAAQARAALRGSESVSIGDVRALVRPVFRHRLVPSFAAESRGVSRDEILTRVLEAVLP